MGATFSSASVVPESREILSVLIPPDSHSTPVVKELSKSFNVEVEDFVPSPTLIIEEELEFVADVASFETFDSVNDVFPILELAVAVTRLELELSTFLFS
ncbi:hypothetical protein [Alkalicoccobacillus plakortidis]|uniref:Uncharacterized protein n=1 Tax=Alkalicoccobacillus plakortidis TaxID=444060 RepID=A0ABT0XIF4_9BACI|nr:hypothetical protein [Alkalicoccobacillus plakortidis]MCM2675691.1 hypothetical protein [Alkalicoccobacillus plakortidis]